ncbi:MAG: DUF5801 repeats-in-toxin domain-containing protein [Alphaproteobacteria bacterium]
MTNPDLNSQEANTTLSENETATETHVTMDGELTDLDQEIELAFFGGNSKEEKKAEEEKAAEEIVEKEDGGKTPQIEVAEEEAPAPSDEELSSVVDEAVEAAKIEPAAGDDAQEEEIPQATARQLAQVEPEAGDTGGGVSSGRGYGFQSSFDAQGVLAIDDVGPINPTELQYGVENQNDEFFVFEESALPPLNPVFELGEYRVSEDGSIRVAAFAAPETEDGTITVTISGIPAGWDVTDEAFDGSDMSIGTGVFDSVAGTWTITLPAGSEFDGGPVFSPPADSDVDALNLTFTVDETNPAGQSGSASGEFDIIVDAVADAPDVDAQDDSGNEGDTLDIDVSALTGEEVNNGVGADDGSENITGYQISGVPAGFTLSAGTETAPGSGVYVFTPAEIAGLQITPTDPNFSGSISLDVTVFTTENPVSDTEFDGTNNDAQATDDLVLTWNPVADEPSLKVDDAQVKEDSSVFVPVEADLADTDGSEFLTITVNGIPSTWGFSGAGWVQTGPGIYEVTVPAGQDYADGFTLTPPADSDVDLTGITVTATSTETANNDSASISEQIDVIVDAVYDDPTVDGLDNSGKENDVLDVDITGAAGDTDGSETVVKYQISDVPTGFTFNQGTDLGGGVWEFTPAEVAGLQVTPPTDFVGDIDVTVTIFTTENPVSDGEFDTTDNDATETDVFNLKWKPVANPPEVKVNSGVDDALVKEDGSVDVPITANLDPTGSGNEVLSVSVTGIDPSWGFSAPVGTYTPATGTWTVTLAPGQDLSTVFTFTPPADSDIDLTGLQATASAYEPSTDTTANATPDDFQIIVDAVADAPSIDADNQVGDETDTLDIDLTALTGEAVNNGVGSDDGSESITGYQISGVPDGFTLSAGTEIAPGVYALTPAEIAGLQITPTDPNYFGTLTLTATVFTTENPVSDGEFDTTDNNAQASDEFTLTWCPVIDPPTINVNNGVDDVLVKEDGTVDVPITAQLAMGASAVEFLTVTVTGIDPAWGSFSAPVGTYTPATGTWTVTLPAGQALDTVFTFTPNGDEDIDLSGLVATAVATDPDAGISASANDGFNVIVDAVADVPNLDANAAAGEEGTTIPLTITTSVNDTDGSEVIEVIKIGNVPTGATLSAGTYDAVNDVWLLNPADLVGLGIVVPDGLVGDFTLSVESVAFEQNTNGTEVDLTDNRASAFDEIKLHVDQDDVPEVEGDEVTVDETDLAPTTSASGNVAADFGADAPGTIEGNGTFFIGDLKSGGVDVDVMFNPQTNTYTGSAGTETIFTLVIDSATGDYTFTLEGVIDHPDTTDHNDSLPLQFGVTAKDSDDDTADAVITVNVLDDGPYINNKFKWVDETNLKDGAIGYTKTLDFDFGQDGAGSIDPTGKFMATFQVGGQNQQLTSGGENIDVVTTPNGYVGTSNGTVIFTLTVDSQTGEYTYTQFDTIDHPDTTNHDDVIWLKFEVQITDADGDTDTAIIGVDVHDDGPVIHSKFKAVDETNLKDGVIGYTKTLDFDFGQDGAGSIDPNGTFTAHFQVGGQNQQLTSGGENIDVVTTANGYIGTANGETIFTLTINDQTGEYTYTQFDTIDHPDGSNPDDVIWLKFGVQITDADGDTDTAIIGVDVHDDGLTAHDDCVEFNASEGLIDGNVVENDTVSQDDPNTVTQVKFEGTVVDVPADGSDVTIDGDFGTLTINNTGDYTYTPFDNVFSTAGGSSSLDPVEADVAGIQDSISKDGITVSVANAGNFDISWVNTADGSGLGIDNLDNGDSPKVWPKGETFDIALDQDAQKVTLTISELGSNNNGGQHGLDYVVTLADGTQVTGEQQFVPGQIIDGHFTFSIDASDFGGQLITSIEINSTNAGDYKGGSFLLNNVEAEYPGTHEECVQDEFEYTLQDGDNDTDTAVLKIKTFAPDDDFIVGQNVDDVEGSDVAHLVNGDKAVIDGASGNDILVGDAGGSFIEQQTQDYNFVFILDVSGSMGSTTDANSKISLLKNAVEDLLTSISTYDDGEIRVHLVPFEGSAETAATFTITDAGELQNLSDYLDSLTTGGFTNYEDPMQEAIAWLSGSEPLGDNAITTTYFISDGQPNRYVDDLGNVVSGNAATVLGEITGSDGTNEVAALQALSDDVIAVGIDIGTGITNLNVIDSDGAALDIDEPSDLTVALADTSPLDKLSAVGGDQIEGGDGDDLIFGDVLFTDDLADVHGLSVDDGAGWEVFERLENGESAVDADWSRDETIDYILNNAESLGQESVNSEGEGRDGGDDVINGGAGNDTIFGQEGDDVINGGAGNDVIYGGSGADTFLFDAITDGTDTVKDFDATEGDLLDLSAILTAYDALTDDIADFVIATENGGETTISIDASGNAGVGGSVEIAVLEGVTGLDLDTSIKTDTVV